MSAWIVHENHINAMVWFAIDNDLIGNETPDKFGQMLWDENYKSVNARYNEKDKAPKFEYHPPVKVPASPEAYAAIFGCYDYQTCEHDGYKKSRAFKFVDWARKMLPEDYKIDYSVDEDKREIVWGWEYA